MNGLPTEIWLNIVERLKYDTLSCVQLRLVDKKIRLAVEDIFNLSVNAYLKIDFRKVSHQAIDRADVIQGCSVKNFPQISKKFKSQYSLLFDENTEMASFYGKVYFRSYLDQIFQVSLKDKLTIKVDNSTKDWAKTKILLTQLEVEKQIQATKINLSSNPLKVPNYQFSENELLITHNPEDTVTKIFDSSHALISEFYSKAVFIFKTYIGNLMNSISCCDLSKEFYWRSIFSINNVNSFHSYQNYVAFLSNEKELHIGQFDTEFRPIYREIVFENEEKFFIWDIFKHRHVLKNLGNECVVDVTQYTVTGHPKIYSLKEPKIKTIQFLNHDYLLVGDKNVLYLANKEFFLLPTRVFSHPTPDRTHFFYSSKDSSNLFNLVIVFLENFSSKIINLGSTVVTKMQVSKFGIVIQIENELQIFNYHGELIAILQRENLGFWKIESGILFYTYKTSVKRKDNTTIRMIAAIDLKKGTEIFTHELMSTHSAVEIHQGKLMEIWTSGKYSTQLNIRVTDLVQKSLKI